MALSPRVNLALSESLMLLNRLDSLRNMGNNQNLNESFSETVLLKTGCASVESGSLKKYPVLSNCTAIPDLSSRRAGSWATIPWKARSGLPATVG